MSNLINTEIKSFLEKNGTVILLSFLIFIFMLYLSRKLNLKKQNCEIIKDKSQDFTFYRFDQLRKANYFKSGISNDYNCKLKDFYFKSAYNCFSSGNFKNDYVDLCALRNCKRAGVRFLDMQVFSLDKIPIIGFNHNDNFFQKESYNHIDFDDGMKEIRRLFLNKKE